MTRFSSIIAVVNPKNYRKVAVLMNTKTIKTIDGVEYLIVSGKNGEKKYCLSTNPEVFTPKEVSEICPEYMFRFCESKGVADLEWYLKQLKKTIKKENNTGLTIERHPTAAEIRQEFIKKYFPSIKTKKEKGYQTQIDRVEAALNKLKGAEPAAKKAKGE